MISFIVPAHNEERYIEACLASILRSCQGLELEILVVADACSDQTVALARQFDPVVRVLEVEHRQISATRHEGALASRGDYLFFLDADTQTQPSLVREALERMESGYVGGGAVFLFDGQLPLHLRLLQWSLALFCRVVNLAGGCSLFCQRQAYFAVDGFDRRLFAGEEIRFCRALKKIGRFCLVRTPALTSGRKLRLYRWSELWPLVKGYLLRGDHVLRDRKGLDIWYARRSED